LSDRSGAPPAPAWFHPHPGPVPGGGEPSPVVGGRSGALRAAIFGINDGLVSNLSLIMGVSGAGADRDFVLLAGIAGLLAGAFSMAAGEYASMKVQREVFERLIHWEAHELATDPEGETKELAGLLEQRGIPSALAGQTAEAIMENPRVALEVHAKEELGLDPQQLGSPWGAAGSSFISFAVGALIPLAPFLFAAGVGPTWTSVTLSLGALFAVGASMSIFTGRPWWLSGSRMMAIGGGAALVTFGVGRLLGVTAFG
jgi:VIT1/CCC1 family predicted Fe2+/Mn2+ transporter